MTPALPGASRVSANPTTTVAFPTPGPTPGNATAETFVDVTIQLLDACDSELRCGEGLAGLWSASVRHELDQGESIIIVVDGDDDDDPGMYELAISLVTG